MTTSVRRPKIIVDLIVLDTPDPLGLANFYAELLGWEIVRTDHDWVTIRGDGATGMAFQLAPDLVPPSWPAGDVPQQFHLDLNVDDLDAGEAFVLSIGARKAPAEEDADGFRVYLDPTGHPFCLCLP